MLEESPVRTLEVVVTATVIHVLAEAALYCRLYEVAPETADQLRAAPVVVIADELRPDTLPQGVAVVNDADAEYGVALLVHIV